MNAADAEHHMKRKLGTAFDTWGKCHVSDRCTHMRLRIKIMIYIYYYTPLPLNLANKQASKQQATSNKQATRTSPFRFGHCSASSLRALLYSSHPRA